MSKYHHHISNIFFYFEAFSNCSAALDITNIMMYLCVSSYWFDFFKLSYCFEIPTVIRKCIPMGMKMDGYKKQED